MCGCILCLDAYQLAGVVAACLLGTFNPDLSADEALELVQQGYSSRIWEQKLKKKQQHYTSENFHMTMGKTRENTMSVLVFGGVKHPINHKVITISKIEPNKC